MGNRKPKKSLEIFLKDRKNTFEKGKLAKFAVTMGTIAVGTNMILGPNVLAAHNNIDLNEVIWQDVAGTKCKKLMATHSQHNQHTNHSNHGNHGSY